MEWISRLPAAAKEWATEPLPTDIRVVGTCKHAAELNVQVLSERVECRFVTVQFVNVLDATGSVITIFRQQTAGGGTLTVTHPEVRHYFMAIPEAAQLVIQAGTMGNGGDISVVDMGEQVRIVDLARDLISLSGLRYPDDIDITFTGLRPGEKLYEELFYGNEKQARKVHEKIFCAQREPIPLHNIKLNISRLEKASHGSPAEARDALADVVAQYADERGLERTSRLIAA